MRWRFQSSPLPGPAEPRREPKPTNRAVHRSPGLWEILSALTGGRTYHILDLGAAVGSNIEYFSRFSCTIRIADLFRSLASDPRLAQRAQEEPEEAFEELLRPGPELFDLILAWDLFSYFDRDQFRALASRLARLARPEARLLALVSSAPEIPDRPTAYKIADPGLLVYDTPCARTRISPGYSPAEVEQTLEGFAADRIFLLRNGVQEYLFVRREDASPEGPPARTTVCSAAQPR